MIPSPNTTIQLGQVYMERSTKHLFDAVIFASPRGSDDPIIVFRNHTGIFSLSIPEFERDFDLI